MILVELWILGRVLVKELIDELIEEGASVPGWEDSEFGTCEVIRGWIGFVQ